MSASPIRIFRITGFVEGTSLVALLFFAMPLKYFADLPEVVTVVGSLHGGLFCLYLLIIGYVTIAIKWNWKWVVVAFLAAFVPFGNYILDGRLKRSQIVQK